MSQCHKVTRSQLGKGLFLSALSGSLLALSFPKFDLEFLAWLAFIPLFFALKNTPKTKAFLFSYICGLVFWAITIYWLAHVTLLGAIVLILYLALYFGIFGLLVSRMSQEPRARYILFAPAIWVLLEYCRSHLLTGFPWALLGYSQYLNLPAIQVADIFGSWGVSFVVMMANTAVYSVLVLRRPAGKPLARIKTILIPALILSGVLGYGFYKSNPKPEAPGQPAIKISIVQGNIPQELKWYPGAREDIMDKYLLISRQALQDDPDLLVWPEAAMPVILQEEPLYFEQAQEFARLSRVQLLLGSVTAKDQNYYNSAILVSARGKLAEQYDKLHLVPFGEYIPLRKILPFLQTIVPIGDITPGREYTVFKSGSVDRSGRGLSVKFGALICFEDVFPELAREFVRRGAGILVNITNDAWYKDTFAAYQHFQPSVLRAVENRVFVVRSANTGVSGFISPQGRILSLVHDESGREIFVDGHVFCSIPVTNSQQTFYTRFGDLPVIFLCSLLAVIILLSKRESHV
jgi:apolipoprotein N-acyltransferase